MTWKRNRSRTGGQRGEIEEEEVKKRMGGCNKRKSKVGSEDVEDKEAVNDGEEDMARVTKKDEYRFSKAWGGMRVGR